ncbi:hypothetical protein K438DRAFT_1756120 [Mycena galopus ATCC 62051]|nr:hypothetical protein K438DRAFT_1756120 [Mycena galopus ATCC 62051]
MSGTADDTEMSGRSSPEALPDKEGAWVGHRFPFPKKAAESDAGEEEDNAEEEKENYNEEEASSDDSGASSVPFPLAPPTTIISELPFFPFICASRFRIPAAGYPRVLFLAEMWLHLLKVDFILARIVSGVRLRWVSASPMLLSQAPESKVNSEYVNTCYEIFSASFVSLFALPSLHLAAAVPPASTHRARARSRSFLTAVDADGLRAQLFSFLVDLRFAFALPLRF